MRSRQTNGNRSRLSQADLDALVQKIIQQALASERAHEHAHTSADTYSDQPILQRGSDWKKAHHSTRRSSSQHGRSESSQTAPRSGAGTTSSLRTEYTGTTHRPTGTAATNHQASPSGRQDRTRGTQQDDLFGYYNDLLNKEFGNPDAYGKTKRSPRSAGSQSAGPYGTEAGSPAIFGSLSDFDEADAFDDLGEPEGYSGYYDPYGFADEFEDPYGSGSYSEPSWYGGQPTGRASGSSRWPYNSTANAYYEPKVELPATLKRLRALEGSTTPDAEPLRGAQLFVAQAKLAADFEDHYERPVAPTYHYLPTYAELTDSELRSYFTWRGEWRHGTNATTPALWAVLLAYEFINSVGCTPGPTVVSRLLTLANAVEAAGQYGSWAGTSSDLRRWARDYVVYYDLDPHLLGDSKQEAFGQAVMTFRRKERWILVENGLLKLGEGEARPTNPTNEELWNATKGLVTFDVSRSPFFRDHESSAAAVWERVFTRMVIHCHKRRKVDYVDSLVGDEFAVPATPFVGVPFLEEKEPPEHTVHLSASEWVSYRFGRWKHHYGYSYTSVDAGLTKLVHALDWRMREVWDYPRKLKQKKIPRYQEAFLSKACEEVHKEELLAQQKAEEAEKRKITFDFSKLGDIRAAAATTREALLVDEEREDYVPTGIDSTETPEPMETPAAETTAKTGVPAKPEPATKQNEAATSPGVLPHDDHPCGLTDLEYRAALLLLDGKPLTGLLGPGTPTEEMLVDSLNEKLFDELGDTAFEYGDSGPQPVEDYADDVRNLLKE